ncbi:MAG: OmpA family protein, partial [Alphaproteobacteria bacterium]|nr:OmpA family protein [Alphaproteobacteria bacterium]
NCKIEIVGYTDPEGGSDHNYDLSVQRANAVREYLEGKNPNIEEIKARGRGEANCTCDLDTGVLQIPVGKENDPDYSVCRGKKPQSVVPDGKRYAPCRRIEMSMKCEKVTTEEQRESTSST